MVLGLVHPSRGTALVDGAPYTSLVAPAFTVGAVLEATGFHPGRTARDHLRILARPNDIPTSRVDQVLDEVGLAADARRRVGGFSLGMRQRLGLAGALLGNPHILVLDEPTNGLDPAGVHWLREMLRARADAGVAVLVSSHLLAELALWADRVVIVQQGRLVTEGTLAELTGGSAPQVRVATPEAERLRDALTEQGYGARIAPDGDVLVDGATSQQVGEVTAAHGIVVLEMSLARRGLEDAFLDLTSERGDE
jgi:ABC-2 type transport system ATP-binding protein